MGRILWPIMALLLLVAVAVPCLTFYMLIKDYWTEVKELRRDLLYCQLASVDLPSDLPFNIDLDLDLIHKTMSGQKDVPSLPETLKLTATTDATPVTIDSPTIDSAPTTSSSTSSSNMSPLPTVQEYLISSSVNPTNLLSTQTTSTLTNDISTPSLSSQESLSNKHERPQLQDSERSQDQDILRPKTYERPYDQTKDSRRSTNGMTGYRKRPALKMAGTFRTPGWGPVNSQSSLQNQTPRNLSRRMVADQSSVDDEPIDQEYVSLLERQIRDLRARVNACRTCLTLPQRSLPVCGGGPAWREHRRRDRMLQRKQRAQKKAQRRKERKQQQQHHNNSTSTTTTTENPTFPPDVEIVRESPDSRPLADIWQRTDTEMKRENLRMRQTHRVSSDFRRGFNQKISRMDEALMQFTDTQAAFCNELRDNLGARLDKRGGELKSLSNQIASLVTSTTEQMIHLETLVSDQVYKGQDSIERQLETTQKIQDAQVRAIQNYHKQTFLPVATAVATILSDQASATTSLGVELITKVEMLQDEYVTYATHQVDTLGKLIEDVEMFATKHNNLVMRSRDHANHLHTNSEQFIRELQTRMNNVVKELVMIRLQSQSFVSLNNDTHNSITSTLSQTQSAVENLGSDLNNRLDIEKEREKNFRNLFRQETDEMTRRMENGISQALMSNHAAMSQIEEAEMDTRVFVGYTTSAWNELYSKQEEELRKDADALTNSLQAHHGHSQIILQGLRSTAETHEQVVEEQRMDFSRFVRKRQDSLDNQCSAITDWAMLMSSELRRRDEDLHRFINEDLLYTTVVIADEDEEGYLLSRLPDGTLMYQSAPRDSISTYPNVTYQLDEVVFGTSETTPVLKSSQTNIKLGNKKVISVGKANNSINAKQIYIITNDTKTDVQNENTLNNNTRMATKSAIIDDTENDSEGNMNDRNVNFDNAGIREHNKETKKDLKVEIIELPIKKHMSLKNKNKENNNSMESETNRIFYIYNTEAFDTTNASSDQETKVNGEDNLLKKESKQNKKMGEQNLDEKKLNDGKYEKNCTKHTLVEGNDDGIKKLRKILKDAQRTIEKFQEDFKIDNSFNKKWKENLKNKTERNNTNYHLNKVSNISLIEHQIHKIRHLQGSHKKNRHLKSNNHTDIENTDDTNEQKLSDNLKGLEENYSKPDLSILNDTSREKINKEIFKGGKGQLSEPDLQNNHIDSVLSQSITKEVNEKKSLHTLIEDKEIKSKSSTELAKNREVYQSSFFPFMNLFMNSQSIDEETEKLFKEIEDELSLEKTLLSKQKTESLKQDNDDTRK